MASSPITSWQIDGETMETVTGFISLGSKITADGDCSHEIKRHLLLERKGMTNLDSILKSRDITLPTKVCIVKAMAFPIVMYGYESWTKRRQSAKELVLSNRGAGENSWESFELQVDQMNQSWRKSTLNIHWKDWCWRSNTLATWCEEPTHRKDPDVGKDWGQEKGGDRRWDGWKASLTQWTWVWANSRRQWRTGKPGVLQSTGSQRVGRDLATEQQQQQITKVRELFCMGPKSQLFRLAACGTLNIWIFVIWKWLIFSVSLKKL